MLLLTLRGDNMNNLVSIDGNDMYTTTLIIAEGVGNDHRNVMRLLNRYSGTEILSSFERSKVTRGGRPVEYAKLDEMQTTFLITLMKNSDIVVSFKEKLTREFFRMRQSLLNIATNKKNQEWLTNRKEGKLQRLETTNIIKKFVKE